MDLNFPLKVLFIWIIGVLHGNNAKTKMKKREAADRGSS